MRLAMIVTAYLLGSRILTPWPWLTWGIRIVYWVALSAVVAAAIAAFALGWLAWALLIGWWWMPLMRRPRIRW